MKKWLIIVFIVVGLTGCNQQLQAGYYTVNPINHKTIYLIDIDTGIRYFELQADRFVFELAENKKLYSFEYNLIDPSKNDLMTEINLGFFNGSIKKVDDVIITTLEPQTSEAIIIQSERSILSAIDDSLVATSIVSFGPVRYQSFNGGYYYFCLGANQLKVAIDDVIVVKKSGISAGAGEEPLEVQIIAYNFLTVEIKGLIIDRENYLLSSETIDGNGITVRNRANNKDITIKSQEVVVVIFETLTLGDRISIYLDAINYNMLGFIYLNPSVD